MRDHKNRIDYWADVAFVYLTFVFATFVLVITLFLAAILVASFLSAADHAPAALSTANTGDSAP